MPSKKTSTGIAPPRRSVDLIDIPDITADELAKRLDALKLTQSQIAALTDLSRLRVRKLMAGDPGSGKLDGHCYRYVYILLTLMESGVFEKAIETDWGFEDFERALATIVRDKIIAEKAKFERSKKFRKVVDTPAEA